MKKIKILVSLVFVLWLSVGVWSVAAFAGQPDTVLPGTDRNIEDCKALMNYLSILPSDEKKYLLSEQKDYEFTDSDAPFSFTANDLMACGIKIGDIHLWMIPYYIRYVLEFVIGIAGLIAVGSIVYGGYLYLFSGLSQDKDTGKKAILYGIVGMILTLVAWAFVNIVIAFVTG